MNNAQKTIAVTGGAGYIGSHTAVELIESNYNVIILDDLSNSYRKAIERIEQITGTAPTFYQTSLLDEAELDKIFSNHSIDAVIHFAGFKAVGESVAKPLEYYNNNVTGTLNLLNVMRNHGCYDIVFSSSATVYGDAEDIPVLETAPVGTITNPYGQTKRMAEQILADLAASDERWNIVILRYFNPAGAHSSGLIGEDPQGIPNNLFPYIAQVAIGKREELSVFGSDYSTPDGTGVRDYIHVVDLAQGHLAALEWMRNESGIEIFNLGTGTGYSVLEVARAYGKAAGVPIPLNMTERRPGDVAELIANPKKAHELLGWRTKLDLDDMCQDSWRWQSRNPHGYRDE